MELPDLPLTGGCQCGALRYRITARPTTLYCCHCTECQAQAASAFGMSLRVPGEGIEMTGARLEWVRGEGEGAVVCVACARCGSRIAHLGRARSGDASIKAGSLDERGWLRPVGHIWTGSAQEWVRASGLLDGLIYEGQPEDGFAALRNAFGRANAQAAEPASAGPADAR